MVSRHEERIITAIDIGTSKVVCLIAVIDLNNNLEIIGHGHSPSRGMRKGIVVNIESTVDAIRNALDEAKVQSGRDDIRHVSVGIAGSHVRGHNQHGVINVLQIDEITRHDVERVLDSASAMKLPEDHRTLHILPQEFIIDGIGGIPDPVGMSGVRLEVDVHLITCANSAALNIIKCCQQCGLEVDTIVLEQVASSASVLSDDEKNMGVMLADIGGGTTDIAVFHEGAIRYTSVLPVGGDHLTNDLVQGLHTTHRDADYIKREHGSCQLLEVHPDDTIDIPGVGDRPPSPMPRHLMVQILQRRVEELFEMARRELQYSGFAELMAAGVVLTGGSSQLDGMLELADSAFGGLPVRIGRPHGVDGPKDIVSSPIYATSIGLLLHAEKHQEQLAKNERKKNHTVSRITTSQDMKNIHDTENIGFFKKIINWLGH
ncbi:MAG: cell division protein FtsA [Mariprofundales bacterium]